MGEKTGTEREDVAVIDVKTAEEVLASETEAAERNGRMIEVDPPDSCLGTVDTLPGAIVENTIRCSTSSIQRGNKRRREKTAVPANFAATIAGLENCGLIAGDRLSREEAESELQSLY